MPLSTDRIPNLPLTGPELKQYTLALLDRELQMRSVPEAVAQKVAASAEAAMSADFLFRAGSAYPHATLTLVVRVHWAGEACAFSVVPSYELANAMYPKHAVLVRGAAPPLAERDGDEGVAAFTLTAKTDNPNAIRVHFGMPITVSRNVPPNPGELFGKTEEQTIEYDPAEVPAPASPEVTDETEEYAAKWGVVVTGARSSDENTTKRRPRKAKTE